MPLERHQAELGRQADPTKRCFVPPCMLHAMCMYIQITSAAREPYIQPGQAKFRWLGFVKWNRLVINMAGQLTEASRAQGCRNKCKVINISCGSNRVLKRETRGTPPIVFITRKFFYKSLFRHTEENGRTLFWKKATDRNSSALLIHTWPNLNACLAKGKIRNGDYIVPAVERCTLRWSEVVSGKPKM